MCPPHRGILDGGLALRDARGSVVDPLGLGNSWTDVDAEIHLVVRDPDHRHARILFTSEAIPGPTLTAGPRLSAEEKTAIARALLSAEGRKVTKRLRQQLGTKQITRATKSEYAGLDTILHGVWGFSS